MAQRISAKRIAIDKAEATLALAVGIATFIVIFSAVASKTLFDQMLYQNKVIDKKQIALDTAEANIVAIEELTRSYQEFKGASTNILGGNPSGDADRDGDNPRIILDALPSKYDFPALTTSLEKLLKDNNVNLTAIEGSDDEIAQSGSAASDQPAPVEMPFIVSAEVNANKGKDLMRLFERSIRPIVVDLLTISKSDKDLTFEVGAKTYYQPEKVLSIKQEEVK